MDGQVFRDGVAELLLTMMTVRPEVAAVAMRSAAPSVGLAVAAASHAVEPGLRLGGELATDRGRVVCLLTVEHGGVLAHQVIHGHRLAVQTDGVLGDRVEAETPRPG